MFEVPFLHGLFFLQIYTVYCINILIPSSTQMLEHCNGKEDASCVEDQVSSPSPLHCFFFSFPSATWPNGFVLFFLVWSESRKAIKLDLGCFGTIGCSKIIGGEKNNGSRGIKEKRKEFGPNCGLSTILNSWRFLFSFYDVSKICHRNWAQTRAHTGYLQICDKKL